MKIKPATGPDEVLQLAQGPAIRSRQEYLENARFLLSRPDLVRQIEDLSVVLYGWRSCNLSSKNLEDFDPLRFDPDFFSPVDASTIEVLNVASNTTSPFLSGVTLTISFIDALRGLASLEKLSVLACDLNEELRNLLSSPSASSICNVIQLSLMFDEQEEWQPTSWYLLVLFPNIKYLTTLESMMPIFAPPLVVQEAAAHHVLERLILTHPYLGEPDGFLRWLRAPFSVNNPIRLTHFKLVVMTCSTHTVAPLLRVLRDAHSLVVLSIDGIYNVSPSFIRLIAECAPDLVALTIVARASNRQRRARNCTWPYATWEYAPPFSAVRRLQHFCWNSTSDLSISPACIRTMEGDLDFGIEREEYLGPDGNSYPEAALFASYCPTLESFEVSAAGIIPIVACEIHRSASGLITTDGNIGLLRRRQWDPSSAFGGAEAWPHVT